jgi:ADP-L-glycero-D-manno-heptose 6-epimerase
MMIRNYESTKVIADWCKNNATDLIYSSSAANYGVNGQHPSNLYGWSKYVAEDYVIMSGGIALRYFNVYGPGEEKKGSMASFIFQAFVKSQNNQQIFLFPTVPRRDFIFIDDVIQANLYAFENYQKLSGQYYEVSTSKGETFENMLDIFGLTYSYLDESEIPEGYQFFTCGEPEKWMDGWEPMYSLLDGVAKYKEYLMRNEKDGHVKL